MEALKVYRLILEVAPLDFDLRLEMGDLLECFGRQDLPIPVYRAIAEHDIKAGNPLRAMVAIKLLQTKQISVTPIIQALQEKYSAGSAVLGRSIKLAPTDYDQPIKEDIDLNYPIAENAFLAQTAAMAAHIATIANYPPLVPPLPIFSAIDAGAFKELFNHLTLKRYHTGDTIIAQGQPGESVYFIARGEVDVVQQRADVDRLQHLARLGPGSLFGEMALLSDEPRSASVVAATDVDALALSRDDAETLGQRIPHVAGAMARFTRERMISNLFATNPLFVLFKDEEKKKLLARFKGHEVPEGTIFLEQGDMGRGLYVMLQGKAEVMRIDGDEQVKLADIGAGDIVGEMSLINEAPVSARVRTKTKATLLFLARELFLPLVENVSELKDYFKRLSDSRTEDTHFKLMADRVSNHFVEGLEEEIDLSDDDIVFI
jgi:cAMP-dependent protein kinase regulator